MYKPMRLSWQIQRRYNSLLFTHYQGVKALLILNLSRLTSNVQISVHNFLY